jgi:hypothetical protein
MAAARSASGDKLWLRQSANDKPKHGGAQIVRLDAVRKK